MRLFLLLFLLLLPTSVSALSIGGTVRWKGNVTLTETVRVEPGGVLIVEPGTTVTFTGGSLEVAGRLEATKATFRGKWQGIVLKRTDAGTRLSDCTVEGAATGLQVIGGSPRLERLTLAGNQVGMELRQKSEARVSGCRFRGNAKVGLFIKDGATPAVTGNVFEKNGKFGAYIFKSSPKDFSGNVFSENPTGVMISHFGSDPTIEGNRFEGNRTAISVDRAARPRLAGNILKGNGTALHLARRSDPEVEGNRFAGNTTGIVVSYSSYPTVRENDLEGNGIALVLEHQSSVYEKANGAAKRQEEAGRATFGGAPRQSVSEADRKPRSLNGTVDVRENWWGEEGTRELARIGAAGNPTFIRDGRDDPTFSEKGKDYPLDKALFTPWSTKKFK